MRSSAGQGMVVVEAMKMQNEMKSPRDGHVTSVRVQENDSVNAGAVLAGDRADRTGSAAGRTR